MNLNVLGNLRFWEYHCLSFKSNLVNLFHLLAIKHFGISKYNIHGTVQYAEIRITIINLYFTIHRQFSILMTWDFTKFDKITGYHDFILVVILRTVMN